MEGPLRVVLHAWIAFAGQATSESLRSFQNRMAMVRANEISVESLHRQGKIIEGVATRHDVAYLSYGLSAPCILDVDLFSLHEWSLALA